MSPDSTTNIYIYNQAVGHWFSLWDEYQQFASYVAHVHKVRLTTIDTETIKRRSIKVVRLHQILHGYHYSWPVHINSNWLLALGKAFELILEGTAECLNDNSFRLAWVNLFHSPDYCRLLWQGYNGECHCRGSRSLTQLQAIVACPLDIRYVTEELVELLSHLGYRPQHMAWTSKTYKATRWSNTTWSDV